MSEAPEFGRPELPAGDRLLTTLFLAALLHLILILGVTFAPGADDEPARSLEVVLVGDELPEAESNPDAAYLSRRTQHGAGNVAEAARAQLAPDAGALREQEGEIDGTDAEPSRKAAAGGRDRLLASQGRVTSTRYVFAGDAAAEERRAADQRVGAERSTPALDVAPDIVLEGPRPGELVVTPDTRESAVAVYLDSWRRKVERVGTLNFPHEARRRRMSGSPVLEVALYADGRLEFVRLRRSSGHPELDQAAMGILRLATPFDPFPREIAARHGRLRFAYEWQFLAGEFAGSSVQSR